MQKVRRLTDYLETEKYLKELNTLDEKQEQQIHLFIDVIKSLQECSNAGDHLPRYKTNFENWLIDNNLNSFFHRVNTRDFWEMMKTSKNIHEYTKKLLNHKPIIEKEI